jgi:hypothetical protein
MSLEPETDYYNIKIKAIKVNFFSDLGRYKELYIPAHLDTSTNTPTDAVIAAFDACVTRLQTHIQDLQNAANSIQRDIDNINNVVTATTTQLGNEKLLNNNNYNLFTNIQTTNSGSKIMISDYKTAYNVQYYNNIEIIIGIILMLGLSSKIFRKVV